MTRDNQIQQRLEDLYEAAINVRADLEDVDALYHAVDSACASLSEALLLVRQDMEP